MSKFDYDYMTDGIIHVVVFNKKKWTKKEAIKQARLELDVWLEEDTELEIFTSYTQYGYYLNCDDEVQNGWHIPDCYEAVLVSCGKTNKVPVWVVKVKQQ